MKSLLLASGLLAVVHPSVALADARDPIQLFADSGVPQSDLAAEGDAAIALFEDGGAILLRASDGRGVRWKRPHTVAEGVGGTTVGGGRVRLSRGVAHLLWFETPPGGSAEPRYRTFHPATKSFGPVRTVPADPDGYDALSFFVTPGTGGTHVHLAYERPGGSGTELVLLSSHDGGATWLAPLAFVPPADYRSGSLRADAAGDTVHLLWIEDNFPALSQRAVHQRSIDGGQTLDFAVPQGIPGAPIADEFDFAVDGDLLAIAYQNFEPVFPLGETTRVVTSPDGGSTFNTPTIMHFSALIPGGGGIPTGDVFIDALTTPRVTIAPGTTRVVASTVAVDELGRKWLFSRTSDDGGVNWFLPTLVAEVTGNLADAELTASTSRDRVVLSWREFTSPTGGPQPMFAAVSLDGGQSFGAPLSVAPFSVTGSLRAFWSDDYQNVLYLLFDTGGNAYVGGFRPQSIAPIGVAAGSRSISGTFSSFDGGADLGWLFFSSKTEGILLPDGRALGLGASRIFTLSLGTAIGGVHQASLSPQGDGTTGVLTLPPAGLPSGLTLHAVGVGFDLDTMTVVDVSDVVTVQL